MNKIGVLKNFGAAQKVFCILPPSATE